MKFRIQKNMLIEMFRENHFSASILDHPVEEEDLTCFRICEENLYISANKDHLYVNLKQITFSELDGNNFLIYDEIGYWYDICKKNICLKYI